MNDTNKSETSVEYNTYEERVVLAGITFVIFVIGTIGNLMVCVAILLSRTLRTRTNVFVVNLSVADLSACMIVPWFAVAFLSQDKWLIPGAEWLCQIAGMMVFISVGSSMWSLTFIAVNRLILINWNLSLYQRVFTSGKIAIMLIISWAVPITLVSIPTLAGFGIIGFHRATHTCSDLITSPKAEKYDTYQASVTGMLLLTIIVCYAMIFIHVKRHFRKRTKQRRNIPIPPSTSSIELSKNINTEPPEPRAEPVQHIREKRGTKLNQDMIDITKNLFIIVCVLLVCLLPVIIANSFEGLYRFRVYSVVIAYSSSSINPLIYAWRHPHFKIVLRLMMRCRYAEIPKPSNLLQRYING